MGRFSQAVGAAVLLGLLSACGGGGGGGSTADRTPDPFDLGVDETSNAPGEYVASGTITVTGINAAASISIENGQFRIVGETEFGDTQPTTVTVNQQVQVRVLSSEDHDTTVTTTLTIDSESDTFSVITDDTSAPTANVIFPTPNTLSDGNAVTLRGNATDDFGAVVSIQAIVTIDDGVTEIANETIMVSGAEDFQDTWSVQVALSSDALNTIQIIATDTAGNVQATPTEITITQTTTPDVTEFPTGDDTARFTNSNYNGVAWDTEGGRNRVLITTSSDEVVAVEILSGTRSVVVPEDPVFQSLSMIHVLGGQDAFLFSDQNGSVIFQADFDGSNVQALTDNATPDSDTPVGGPFGMVQDSSGLLYVANAGGSIYSVVLDSGARSLISDDETPAGGANQLTNPTSVMISQDETRALVAEYTGGQLLWVALDTGARTVLVDNDVLTNPFDIKLDADDNRAIFTDEGLDAVLAVDLGSGAVTVISSDDVPVGGANDLHNPWGIAIDEINDIAFVLSDLGFDSSRAFIMVVDLNSGERVVLTNPV